MLWLTIRTNDIKKKNLCIETKMMKISQILNGFGIYALQRLLDKIFSERVIRPDKLTKIIIKGCLLWTEKQMLKKLFFLALTV